jgi:NAD-dependent DNA ligase
MVSPAGAARRSSSSTYAARGAMDIVGLGGKTVRQLIEQACSAIWRTSIA